MILTLSAPALYALELTPRCNNRCAGCYNVFASDREHTAPILPLRDWRAILERIRPSAHLVKLTGGEPTLYPHLAGLIALLDELEITFSLFTNARWPDPAGVIQVLQASSAFRGLLISLHGTTATAHEAFSGVRGSFDETIDNIRRATAAGLPVVLSTVIHRRNLDELAQLPALCADLGADHISFNRYLGPPAPQVEPLPKELYSAVSRIEEMRRAGQRVKFGNCIPQCFVTSSAMGCLAGVAYCTIDPWGNVRPCNHSPTRCGNLLQESVASIWQGKAMEQWRQRIPPECHTCAAFPQCHGGCRAQAETLALPADPLMDKALRRLPQPEQVEMYAGWRPLRVCKIRQEPFGYVLLRGNHIVPLAGDDLGILEACDGQTTLSALGEQLGQRGLQLIYELYRRGIVEMQD